MIYLCIRMKIEEEIKQTKPFESELSKLIVNIQFTASWLNGRFARQLKSFGITPQQYNVLRILRGKHPDCYCNQEITERMIDRSSNSTRIVDKLVEKKLLIRTENNTDRRLVDIRITKEGLRLLEELDSALKPHQQKLKKLSAEQARQMNEWLDELRS